MQQQYSSIFSIIVGDDSKPQTFAMDTRVSSVNKAVLQKMWPDHIVFQALKQLAASYTNFAIKMQYVVEPHAHNPVLKVAPAAGIVVIENAYTWEVKAPQSLNITGKDGLPIILNAETLPGAYRTLQFNNPWNSKYAFQDVAQEGAISVRAGKERIELPNIQSYASELQPHALGIPNAAGYENERRARASQLLRFLKELAEFRKEKFDAEKALSQIGRWRERPEKSKQVTNNLGFSI